MDPPLPDVSGSNERGGSANGSWTTIADSGRGRHRAGAGIAGVGMVTVWDTLRWPTSVGVAEELSGPVLAPTPTVVAAPSTATRTALRRTARVLGRVSGWLIWNSYVEGEWCRFAGRNRLLGHVGCSRTN